MDLLFLGSEVPVKRLFVIRFFYFEFIILMNNYLKYCFCRYIMNSVITALYFIGRVYEENDGVIFEGSKEAIQIKRRISLNALKKKLEIR